jgi:phosphatidate cytidylyltransferase
MALNEWDSAAMKAKTADLPQRVMSAAIMISVSITCAWFGGLGWALIAAFVMGGIAFEWGRMVEPGSLYLWPRALIAAICGVAFVLAPRIYEMIAVLGFFLVLFRLPKGAVGVAILGAAYLALSGWALAGLRVWPEMTGRTLLFGLFAVVWATDSAAYGVGRLMGGPKIMPIVSPNKTWSGCIGGVVAGVLAGALYALLSETSMLAWAITGFLISVAAQAGDLLESLAKRRFGVKDASGIIPGHGGLLDRLDGHLSAAAVLVILVVLVPGLVEALA